MKQRDLQLMKAIGLTYWQIRKPGFYPEQEQPVIDLPETCQLLFVCDDELDEHDRWLFGRILGSMKLQPEQALCIPAAAVEQIREHHLKWCWVAGCEAAHPADSQLLTSASLKSMHTNPGAKKALWQQICSYDA